MTDDIEPRKLNAIVGSALKALAEGGADDEFIGAFAASHRAKVAKILGHPEAALQPPDLQMIVAQAVTQALADAGMGKGKASSKQAARRINVVVAGQRTSVTLARNTVAQLVEAKGGKQANEFIQELVNNAPVGVPNRSGWVEERLRAFLSFGQTGSAGVLAHH